jgi:hypothetical protein
MKLKKIVTIGCLSLGLMSPLIYADTTMNETLVRIVNQLDALLPLIDQAEREQPPNQRVMFHFSSFEGSDGELHTGLREDVMSMKAAILAQLDQAQIDPENVTPMPNDFIGEHR